MVPPGQGSPLGLTICAQPRRILAQQLCERVRTNRKMHYHDRTVGYMIARESSRDSSAKLLYCTEAIVALMMQTYLVSSNPPLPQDLITTMAISAGSRSLLSILLPPTAPLHSTQSTPIFGWFAQSRSGRRCILHMGFLTNKIARKCPKSEIWASPCVGHIKKARLTVTSLICPVARTGRTLELAE